MLQSALDFLKSAIQPAAPSSILLLVGVAVVLLYLARPRLARRWLVAVIAAYWLMATPACVEGLQWPLTRGYQPIADAAAAGGARVIVVLSGGSRTSSADGLHVTVATDGSLFRSLEAARLYRLLGGATIIATGGVTEELADAEPESAAIRRVLVGLGVPASDIVTEDRSRTTRDQALEVRDLIQAMGGPPFVLVTSPAHMRRSMAAFAAVGLHPVPSVSAQVSGRAWRRPWLPDQEALGASGATLYQYAALVYYWSQGWLGPADGTPEPPEATRPGLPVR
ncbi:MAG: YdcF family protein [Vicinamibacterales bacterium]